MIDAKMVKILVEGLITLPEMSPTLRQLLTPGQKAKF